MENRYSKKIQMFLMTYSHSMVAGGLELIS